MLTTRLPSPQTLEEDTVKLYLLGYLTAGFLPLSLGLITHPHGC